MEWFRNPQDRTAISADVFGTAPRELTRSVTLRQTVELVRTTIEVVEEGIGQIAQGPAEQAALREGMLRYSREIAFAAAQVYAQAAELRGAWDARLEALVVDELMRGDVLDDTVRSRAAALGWDSASGLVVVVGATPKPLDSRDNVRQHTALVADAVHRAARRARLTVLTGVQSDRLVVIIGGAEDPLTATRALANEFGPGPLVIGPVVEDLLSAGISAQAALSALRAARRVAGRAAPGAGRRTAAGAGPGRRRGREGSTGGRGVPAAGGGGRRRCSKPCRRIWNRPRPWRAPPGCSSFTPTPCATGSKG